MHRPRFLVDVDEVLADFQGPAFEIIKRVHGLDQSAHDFKVWDVFEQFSEAEKARIYEHIDRPGWCRSLKPFKEAQDAIEAIRSMGFNVFALTSPHHSPHWYFERVEWLKEHFGMDKRNVVQTRSKFLVQGDAFLDDNPEHITHWRDAYPTKLAMLWHIPNTHSLGMDDVRVKSWDEVLDRLRGLRRAA